MPEQKNLGVIFDSSLKFDNQINTSSDLLFLFEGNSEIKIIPFN